VKAVEYLILLEEIQKMQASMLQKFACLALAVTFSANAAVAQDCAVEDVANGIVCCHNSSQGTVFPKVCLDWATLTGPPQNGTHFNVTFEPTTNIPSVQLITGTTASTTRDWQIWSVDSSDDPDAIGTISIVDDDPLTDNDHDYTIKVDNPDLAKQGATSSGPIDMKHPDVNWTGFSTITGGKVTGDVAKDATTGYSIRVVDDGTTGGSVNLEVQGNVLGDIDVGTIANGDTLRVTGTVHGETTIGDISGESKSSYGTVDLHQINERLLIEGDVDGHLRVTNIINGTSFFDLKVEHDTGPHSKITLDYIASRAEVLLGASASDMFYGTLEFESTQVTGNVCMTSVLDGVVDFKGNDLRTEFALINGSTIYGKVYINDIISTHIDISTGTTGGDFRGLITVRHLRGMGTPGIQWDHAGVLDGTIWVQGYIETGIKQFGPPVSGNPDTGSIIVSGEFKAGALLDFPDSDFGPNSSIQLLNKALGNLKISYDPDRSFDGSLYLKQGLEGAGAIQVRNLGGIMTIGQLTGTTAGQAPSITVFGEIDDGTIKVSRGGVKENQTITVNTLGANGTLDLNLQDVAGAIAIDHAIGGQIVNIADVTSTGVVTLATGSQNAFGGNATFANLDPGGSIRTFDGADLTGNITVTGIVDDSINIAGDMKGGASIIVEEELAGSIFIDGDIAAGSMIDVHGALAGGINVQGSYDGGISVGENTTAGSLITLSEGIGCDSSIVLNDNAKFNVVAGDILLGIEAAPLPDIVIEGSITTKSPASLTGDVTLSGCHSEDLCFDLCGFSGTFNVDQGGCAGQYTITELCGCDNQNCP
jgi:hypothetical protein